MLLFHIMLLFDIIRTYYVTTPHLMLRHGGGRGRGGLRQLLCGEGGGVVGGGGGVGGRHLLHLGEGAVFSVVGQFTHCQIHPKKYINKI